MAMVACQRTSHARLPLTILAGFLGTWRKGEGRHAHEPCLAWSRSCKLRGLSRDFDSHRKLCSFRQLMVVSLCNSTPALRISCFQRNRVA